MEIFRPKRQKLNTKDDLKVFFHDWEFQTNN